MAPAHLGTVRVVEHERRREDVMAEISVVVFKVGSSEFAADIANVEGIVTKGKVTRLPQMPDYVEGVMNLRGEVLPLINLKKKLNLELQDVENPGEKVMVAHIGERKYGLVIDEVESVSRFQETNLDSVPESLASDKANYLAGIIKENDRFIILLDLEKLLTTQEKVDIGGMLEQLS
ncbi:MAG: purine-binding chemotaxis protein CheW [Thermotogota bacterium]|nr:purine-binding chemotaxis protein CheW [Thermotogota bacterium]